MPREERRIVKRHHDREEDQESQRVEDHRARPARPSALSFIQHAPELYAYRPPGLGGEDADVTPKLTWRKRMRGWPPSGAVDGGPDLLKQAVGRCDLMVEPNRQSAPWRVERVEQSVPQ